MIATCRWVIVVMLLCALPVRADEPSEAMKVTFLEGRATAQRSGAGPVPLAPGSELHEGEVVATGPDGKLELLLPTGTLVRLGPGTRLELRAASGSAQRFTARLAFGNLWAKVHKLLAGEEFKVETENAVAGVRGTEFRVEVAPAKEDLVRVYEGVVEVKDHGGAWTHRVEPGHELVFRHGTAPARPKEFAAASEAGHPFMKWVRERKERPVHLEKHEKPEHHKHEKR